MLIIATFKHSAYLELGLKQLEQNGISRANLIVAPLDKPTRDENQTAYKIVHEDGKSPYDKAFIFGTICMLLGAIYGFVLVGGPIIWAMIGLITGGVLGLIVERYRRRSATKPSNNDDSEVVVLIQCASHQTEFIERFLWNHNARGVSKIPSYPEAERASNPV